MKNDITYEVTTGDNLIHQKLLQDNGDLKTTLMERSVDLADEQVKKALIDLGWTPPDANTKPEAPKKFKRWSPEKGNDYYTIDDAGNCNELDTRHTNVSETVTYHHYSMGNVFSTKTEAEIQVEFRKSVVKVADYIRAENSVIDDLKRYLIMKNDDGDYTPMLATYGYINVLPYCKTKALVIDVIEKFPDELDFIFENINHAYGG